MLFTPDFFFPQEYHILNLVQFFFKKNTFYWKKGKGYEPAEKMPDKFHATSAFDVKTGESIKQKEKI